MKKLILLVSFLAFAVAAEAGGDCCAKKGQAACADKAKNCPAVQAATAESAVCPAQQGACPLKAKTAAAKSAKSAKAAKGDNVAKK